MIKVIEQRNTELIQKMLERNQFEFVDVNGVVADILKNVQNSGDEAVREYTHQFDGIWLDDFKVSLEEWNQAETSVSEVLKNDLIKARDNIRRYHEKQRVSSYMMKEDDDVMIGQIIKPIERVGIYVPGGSAAYPSTVLMNAIPAKIAGVNEIVMITPPNKDGKIKESILLAAKLAGVDVIYKVGGAQGIGALAYGTKSIPKVNKIVGPGNIYVAMAKKMVTGYVGIDMVAGPSEILIIADETANPDYIAADLMGQAEHDPLAASILLTTSKDLSLKVIQSLETQIKQLNRKGIIESSLSNFGAIVVTDTLDDAINLANQIAPEHLEILTKDPFSVYPKVENAGAIFLGEYTPEPVGDYFAGPNHTLPTSGTAKFASPLSTTDFIKKTSLLYYSKEALTKAKDSIIRIAYEEGLTAHANAVSVRFKKEE